MHNIETLRLHFLAICLLALGYSTLNGLCHSLTCASLPFCHVQYHHHHHVHYVLALHSNFPFPDVLHALSSSLGLSKAGSILKQAGSVSE